MTRRVWLFAAAAALLLTGCASQATVPSPSPTHEPAETYSTVVQLRDAFVAVGGPCPDWVQGDRVTLAAQSGDCSDTTVLSIYSSQDDKDQVVANLKSLSDDVHLLIGENWIINTPHPEEYAEELGGIVVTK